MNEDIQVQDPNGKVQVYKKEDFRRVNDPYCEHELEDDPSDETETFKAKKCKKCPYGKLVRKNS